MLAVALDGPELLTPALLVPLLPPALLISAETTEDEEASTPEGVGVLV